MKVVKIIATCFVKRNFRQKSYLTGDPLGYFGHSQTFSSPEEILDLINFNILIEKKFNPGVEKRDLIIVNNDVGFKKGNNFLKKISGMKIPFGKIITFNRKNIGMSFGAYSDAFKKYKTKYDFFLFTEDDNIICKDNYFKIGIDIFRSVKNAGFLAYIHSTKVGNEHIRALNLNKKNAISCHGAIGLSSQNMLNRIFKKYRKLPYYEGNNYKKCITYGEVAFPNSFIKMGYKIIDLPKDLILTIPACDLMNGIRYKKWPNILEKIIFYLKDCIYKIFSLSNYSQKLYLKSLKFVKNRFQY
jgi:hypothetical protein